MAWKLTPHAFLRFWDLHAWAGVIAGLVLYVMFLTGGITLFNEQLRMWEDPLAQRSSARVEAAGLQRALDRALAATGGEAGEIWFYPPKHGRGEFRVSYEVKGHWDAGWVDSSTQRLVPDRERLASFLYDVHFLWHDLTGEKLYWVAGFLSVALFLALVTGVLIHLKDIVRQFHQFRPDKSRRTLWSDLHKVVGVMGLPFQLMYAFTGAFFILAPFVLKVFTGPVFNGDEKRAALFAWGEPRADSAPPGAPFKSLSLDELGRRARSALPGFEPALFHVLNPGRDNGVVEVWGMRGGTPSGKMAMRLKAADGQIESLGVEGSDKASAAARRWIYGLHFASFGGLPVRILFFLMSLAGCATILSGNWVWISRRAPSRGREILSRLTTGVGAGLWVAVAALFLVSRVLPLTWLSRGTVEELTFLGTLAACMTWAVLSRDPGSLWWKQLALSAGLFLPVPLLATLSSSAGLFGAGPRIGTVVAVDVSLVLTAAALGASAWALRRKHLNGAKDG